jgi:hypothetical protein
VFSVFQVIKSALFLKKKNWEIHHIWPLLVVGIDVLAAASGHDAHQLAL